MTKKKHIPRFSKLNEEQVKDIRRRHKERESVMSLSRAFLVCPRTIRDIVTRHTWKNV